MGQGGYITLVNGTPYDWTRTNTRHYQMNAWSFPERIAAGTTATVYVEWDQHIFHTESDDSGSADYALNGTSYTFQIQARAKDGFNLSVVFTNLSTSGSANGSTLPLGWKNDGTVAFVLAGDASGFMSNLMPTAWMQGNLKRLGGRTLRQICIPGSHDAGMSQLNDTTAFATRDNVLTQTTDILGQLTDGSRYFDIRPVISRGQYFTGHYSQISDFFGSWQGGNGQSIDEIVSNINAYTASSSELVILSLSHDLNTDLGNTSYQAFTRDEWNGLFGVLAKLHNLYVAPPGTSDLTQLKLADFIGGGKAAVVVILRSGDSGVLGNYAGRGFYSDLAFPVSGGYSDTDDLARMSSDQLAQMKKWKTSSEDPYFELSWTLTQQVLDTVVGPSVLDLAAKANEAIYGSVLPACTTQCFPNSLYVDAMNTQSLAALAMAINTKISL